MGIGGRLKIHQSKFEQLRSKKGNKVVRRDKRREILTKASKSLIYAIISCCLNVLNGFVILTTKQRKVLHSYRFLFIKLIDHSLSLEGKRKLLIQQGDFLPTLLTIILDASQTYGVITRRNSRKVTSK